MSYTIQRYRASKTDIRLAAGSSKTNYSNFSQGAPGMAEQSNIEMFRSTAPILRFQLTTPEPAPNYVTGWTTVFTVRTDENANAAVLSIAGALSDVNNALRYGIFDVPVSAANSALLTNNVKYDWSFRRTDEGYEDVLGHGELRAVTVS